MHEFDRDMVWKLWWVSCVHEMGVSRPGSAFPREPRVLIFLLFRLWRVPSLTRTTIIIKLWRKLVNMHVCNLQSQIRTEFFLLEQEWELIRCCSCVSHLCLTAISTVWKLARQGGYIRLILVNFYWITCNSCLCLTSFAAIAFVSL